MSNAPQAHKILSQAREILLERLAERIVENREEILDDARGNSYLGEIEALYEQMGMKLSHLNQILGVLPNEVEAPQSPPSADEVNPYRALEDQFGQPRDVDPSRAETPVNPYASMSGQQLLALPAPVDDPAGRDTASRAIPIEAPPATVEEFVTVSLRGNESTAAILLGRILDCGHDQATVCARVFIERFRDGGNVDSILTTMRRRIVLGGYNDGLMLLWDYFGLSGFHAIAALQTLRLHLSRP